MEDGDPGVIRTRGLRFRKPSLYPAELRGHCLKRFVKRFAKLVNLTKHMHGNNYLDLEPPLRRRPLYPLSYEAPAR